MATALPAPLRRALEEPGAALSAMLHLLLLLAALWYVARRPPSPPELKSFPVDLVALQPVPGPSGAAAAAHRGAPTPRPQAAPQPEGIAPDAVRQPLDELSAQLRALAQLRAPDTPLAIGGSAGEGGGASGNGSYALRDFIRAQILRRWLPDLGLPGGRDVPVRLRISVTGRGAITDIVIADQARFAEDKLFHEMALSARNAAMLASPIQMPRGVWPALTVLDIDLDPKAALR